MTCWHVHFLVFHHVSFSFLFMHCLFYPSESVQGEGYRNSTSSNFHRLSDHFPLRLYIFSSKNCYTFKKLINFIAKNLKGTRINLTHEISQIVKQTIKPKKTNRKRRESATGNKKKNGQRIKWFKKVAHARSKILILREYSSHLSHIYEI